MPDSVAQLAPWVALACAVGAGAAAAWTGWAAWRRWRELQVVRRAARALVDVHAERLEASVQQASEATGQLAEGGDQLAEALAQLRGDVEHLRWLAARVGDERERLLRELADIVLPSGRPGRDDA